MFADFLSLKREKVKSKKTFTNGLITVVGIGLDYSSLIIEPSQKKACVGEES